MILLAVQISPAAVFTEPYITWAREAGYRFYLVKKMTLLDYVDLIAHYYGIAFGISTAGNPMRQAKTCRHPLNIDGINVC